MFEIKLKLKDNLVSPLSILFDKNNYRNTNKTTLFAQAFIVVAYRNPYTWIEFFDHIQTNHISINNIRNRIISQINVEYFQIKENKIKYIPKKYNENLEDLFKNSDIVKNFGIK